MSATSPNPCDLRWRELVTSCGETYNVYTREVSALTGNEGTAS
ncbi:MAG TPA: hypothetical protein VKD90_04695 [Gemmataceae bacterium]|nr:hypothetical protein [Gemmataceae bacterium]